MALPDSRSPALLGTASEPRCRSGYRPADRRRGGPPGPGVLLRNAADRGDAGGFGRRGIRTAAPDAARGTR
ncbi:hypothetical protein DEF23_26825 [Marinitenerispora sediminis]|nr:hypothetical protein DEF23_26825 [Marinitenerispora sediminis]RCV54686.1 hypothetical protein DEF28_07625 [Marinitenerispora sediminis]